MNTSQHALRPPMPGPAWGDYPQRDEPEASRRWPAAWWQAVADPLLARHTDHSRRRFVAQVRRAQAAWPAHGSQAFNAQLRDLRAQLGSRGLTEPLLASAMAAVALALQAIQGIRVFDTQLRAARILLANKLAEMATGEGKTHAAFLAGATAALAGVPVHMVTANAYLASRDAERLAPVHEALGLRVAAIQPGDDDPARHAAYRCDVVYCTASDLIFDYLRDHIAAEAAPRLLRGLCMAIVDEADSVLIDEARTPFILAAERHDGAAAQRHRSALALASGLRADDHYRLDRATRRAHLQPLGRQVCAGAAAGFGADDALWTNARFREELITRALAALHLYQRDVDYLLRQAPGTARPEVAIIDGTTGRIAQGRRWSQGLHQLIELKEGFAPSPLQHTRAQLTYQKFFPRYWRLAGLSGTLHEARRELLGVYRLRTERVPLRTPSLRRSDAPAIFLDGATRWDAVVQQIRQRQGEGRPVLVGTDSVADTQGLSARLHAIGLPHQRLDARQDADEAQRIAQAGQAGCVTVATNMAGRGTDIVLGHGVAQLGGLHVISCQQNASARLDRQLHGRAARHGEPGSVSTLLALDEGLLVQRFPPWVRWALALRFERSGRLPAWLARPLLGWTQAQEEGRARRQRARLQETDHKLLRSLGFGARIE